MPGMAFPSRLFAIVSAGIALGAAGIGTAAVQTMPERIKLGVLASMTGGGSLNGAAMDIAVKMAVKEINDAGGVRGRPVDIMLADTQSDPTIAVGEAKRLAFQEKISLLLGPDVSQITLAVLPTITEAKLFQVSISGASTLTPAAGPYHFSLQPSAEAQGVAMADHAVQGRRLSSLAILADNGGTSKTAVAAMKKRLAELNAPPAAEQEYPFRVGDMTPHLLSLRRANPQALLFIATIPDDLTTLARTLKDIGWTVPVVGGVGVATFAPLVVKTVGPEAFRTMVGLSGRGYTYCAGDALGQSDYAQFLRRFRAFAPDIAGKVAIPTVAWNYGAVSVLKSVVSAVGTTDGPTLAAWLEQNAGTVPHMVGTLSASRDSHFLLGPESMAMVQDPDMIREDGLQRRFGC
jgi:branched-chain amino acid transport system substrate-binding protein